MRLFNVDQEHWEEVATQDIAPSSALAYETQAAQWISKNGMVCFFKIFRRAILILHDIHPQTSASLARLVTIAHILLAFGQLALLGFRSPRALAAEISSSENSSPCFKNARLNPVEPQMPPAGSWPL